MLDDESMAATGAFLRLQHQPIDQAEPNRADTTTQQSTASDWQALQPDFVCFASVVIIILFTGR